MAKREKSLLARNLIGLRKHANYSQETIAKYLGVTRSTYAYYEIDVTPPQQMLIKIAQFFEVFIDDLLTSEIDPVTRRKKALSVSEPEIPYGTDDDRQLFRIFQMLGEKEKKQVEDLILKLNAKAEY